MVGVMTVLIVDDHPLVRGALTQQVLSLLPGAHVLAAGSAAQARTAASRARRLDLILLDMNLPDGDGLNLLGEWKAGMPNVPVVVVTGEPEAERAAASAGAAGFVSKTAPESALREVIGGALRLPAPGPGDLRHALDALTLRQQEVLRALIAGKSNLDIATQLSISEPTVKVHLTAIFKALRVVSRTQAVLAVRNVGW